MPPLAFACLWLSVSDDELAAWGYMILAGVTSGMTMVFFDAFWPQAYGTRHLGSIRGLAFAFMVLTGALAPALMGAALDGGVAIEAITLACTVYCAFASLIAVPATRLFRRK